MTYSRKEFLRNERRRNRVRRSPIFWISRIFIALVALFIAYGIALQMLGLM